ncbi:MAG: hypothetical protein PHH98_05190 [Candidatus Gracilibacteria bacterium]|nr:hypothetical protein [Candidatus Gracilibacteria bacterium]
MEEEKIIKDEKNPNPLFTKSRILFLIGVFIVFLMPLYYKLLEKIL